jgi:hypothetical protein
MSLAAVQAQSASPHPLGELIRVLQGRVRVVFSMVEPHVRHDLAEPEHDATCRNLVRTSENSLTKSFAESTF